MYLGWLRNHLDRLQRRYDAANKTQAWRVGPRPRLDWKRTRPLSIADEKTNPNLLRSSSCKGCGQTRLPILERHLGSNHRFQSFDQAEQVGRPQKILCGVPLWSL